MRSSLRARLTVAGLTVALAVGGVAVASSTAARTAQVDVAQRAAEMIRVKIEKREAPIKRRLAALYRLTRSTRTANVLTPVSSRRAVLASNLRWALKKDLHVFGALRDELAHVEAEAREIQTAERALPQPRLDLKRPLAMADGKIERGFGVHAEGRIRLSSRGVTFSTRVNAPIVAPLAGTVVFAGKTAGGQMVVIEQGSVWVVLAPVLDAPAIGTVVARDQALGKTASRSLLLEMRIADDRGGTPVDPGPLAAD